MWAAFPGHDWRRGLPEHAWRRGLLPGHAWRRPAVRASCEPLASVVHELRVLLLEGQYNVAHRPVAMLGDDDVRLSGTLGVLVVVLLAVDEHHQVCVLLDGPGFS